MRTFRIAVALAAVVSAAAAHADATQVRLIPPTGARFLPGQKFDIRVEGKASATSPSYSATLKLDGRPVAFTSGSSDPVNTDGISAAGFGGFNIRGFSIEKQGKHTLTATFGDGTGAPVTVSSEIEVAKVGHGQGV